MRHQTCETDLAALIRWAKTGALLVIGDLMLDEYIRGTVTRISPEAPVPVVQVRQKLYAAGGAANVALNLRGLGCKVFLAGVIGDDEDGQRLIHVLTRASVNTEAIITVESRPTTVKTRIQDERQQMLRLDREVTHLLEESCYAELGERVSKILAFHEIHAILLSDYNKGMLGKGLCHTIIEMARMHSIPVLVNPKGNDYSRYMGATMISVNRLDLALTSGRNSEELDGLFEAASQIRQSLQLDFLTLTLGDSGIALVQEGGIAHFPADAKEVYDVSGAGDTVIATITAAICAGVEPAKAIQLANAAAGVVVGKLGTSPVTVSELIPIIASRPDREIISKIYLLHDLATAVATWRQAGNRIVFINGCFDLLHPGHIALLEQARKSGDKLIVALNTDRSVRALKGPGRPIMGENERTAMIAALSWVHAVILFDELTPIDLIMALRPDVLVKGGDYREDEVVGAKEVREWGGTVVIVPLVKGISTSSIIDRMLHRVPANTDVASLKPC